MDAGLDSSRGGPLAGLRILDLSRQAPGPFATMYLGDWGADVITVEPPSAADPTLRLPMHEGMVSRDMGTNPLFRSRRSIVVNAKDERGAEILRGLAREADVFVEGFRPGACDRLGLGYQRLAEENPGIVYCSITGYGAEGDHAGVAGHDINYLAEAGLLATTTRDCARPGIPLNAVADHAAGGLYAALAIMVALRGRERTGRGTHIDTSMVSGVLNLLQVVPSWIAADGLDPSWGGGYLTGAAPFYDCYRTADDRWISVGAVEPKFFVNVCQALGVPELSTAQLDRDRWDEIREAFTAAFATRTLEEWEERLSHPDLCVAPVRSIPEAFEVWESRGVFGAVDRSGPRLSAWEPVATEPVRTAGQHSREVLLESGFSESEIDELVWSEVIEDPSQAAAPTMKGTVD